MKKHITIAVFLSITYQGIYGQLHSGINLSTSYPFDYFSNQVDFGYGFGMSAGYFYKNFDLTFEYEINSYITQQPSFRIVSEALQISYRLKFKNISPYLGIKNGLYHQKTEVPYLINGNILETTLMKEQAYGIAPTTGIILSSKKFTHLNLNIGLSYNVLFFNRVSSLLKLDFGINYLFNL